MSSRPTHRFDEGHGASFTRALKGSDVLLNSDEWLGSHWNVQGNSSRVSFPELGRSFGFVEERQEASLALLGALRNLASDVQRDPLLRLNPDVVGAIAHFATSFKARIGEYSPYHVSLGVTSFAMAGYRDEELFRQVHDHVKTRADELSVSAIADLVWSCGTLMIREPTLLDTLKKAALRKERAARMSDREDPRSAIPFKERALLSWGFAAASSETKREGAVKQFAHAQDLNRAGVSFNHWHLMYQALVIAGMVDGKDYFPNLEGLEQRQDERAPNNFETAVLHSAMNLLGEGRQHSYYIHKRMGGVETDLMVSTPHGEVVIESDGEAFHRLIGPDGGMLRGKDQAQDLFLNKLGVAAVVHIGSWEWDPLWGEDILRDKIKSAAPFLLDRP